MRKNSTVINALYGIVVALILAVISIMITNVLPNGYVGASVMAMLIGMVLHPLVKKLLPSFTGIDLVAKRLLKVSIVLMGGVFKPHSSCRGWEVLSNSDGIYFSYCFYIW
ncbi:putative sulfate exporter family transporter [Ruoffia sp. FAM 26255]|uniref:putative sulfate exporter family transporter n=1 Tax=Ruoffia sp. FAM 26255 TaxID=3259519 RepID=UPI0038881246